MEEKKLLPRIMIASVSSGSGKTALTCGILKILLDEYEQQSGAMRPVAYKCGPDYIDPMFHRYVSGVPSGNLDTFFTDAQTACYLLSKRAGKAKTSAENSGETNIAVTEGVMGYYDGLGGISVKGSSYDVAAKTQTPVILIADGRGMSLSVLGVIRGFTDPGGITGSVSGDESFQLIKGVILNRVTESVYSRLKPLIEERCGISVLGYVPETDKAVLPGRHLGLMLPEEIDGLRKQISDLADILRDTLDMGKIKETALNAPVIPDCSEFQNKLKKDLRLTGENTGGGTVRIGVARDEAFCFYYEDNLELLRELGAETVFFSPLHDASLPENLSGLYMGGGYPELHCPELSSNISMQRSIAGVVEAGMPCLAECGSFMFLHDEMEDENGKLWPMAGIVPGRAVKKDRAVRFGYAYLTADEETILGPLGISVPVHEFHYWDTTNNSGCFTAAKPVSDSEWKCMYHYKNLLAGFPHFYFYADPGIAGNFVSACRKFGKERTRRTAE